MRKVLLLLTILMVSFSLAYSQQHTVNGTVTSEDGAPVPFATVQIKGTSTGTTTNENGAFQLSVPADATLHISYVGYTAKDVAVGNQSTLNITLVSNAQQLNELVVTALGISRQERSLGYASSNVTSEEINRTSPNSLLGNLEGKIPGVEISNVGGQPGSSTKVILRGYSSLQGGNQPLYVIDGVPLDNNRPGSGGGLDFGNNANDINPDDIASINILRGAAASSLYGSQAKNGVILITTKKGKAGSPKAELNSSITLSNVGMLPTFQNTFGQGWDATFILSENGSWGPKMDGKDRLWGSIVDNSQLLKPFSPQKNSMKDFYETGVDYNNTVSYSGGNGNSTFYLSYGNVYDDGILPGNNDMYKRNTLSLRGTQKWGKFSASASINYVNKNSNYQFTEANSGIGASMFEDILQIPRDIYIPDFRDYTNKFFNVDNYFTPYAENPYFILNQNGSKFKSDRVFGNVNLNYDITKWMSAEWRIGADITNGRLKAWHAKDKPSPGSWNDGANVEGSQRQADVGDVDENSQFFGDYNSDFLLKFKTKINRSFSFDGLAGFNYYETDYRAQDGYIQGLSIPGFYDLSNSPSPPTAGTAESHRKKLGVYAQANLSFKDYLFLSLNARNDWSSTLPINKNSFFYPGASLAFVLSDFLHLDPSGVSFAKIRASWGKTGNDAPPYSLQSVLVPGDVALGFGETQFPIAGVSAYEIANTIGNSNLKPEINTEYELGTELKFLHNRIGIDFTYYDKKTDGQILNVSIAPSTGYTSLVNNFGLIQNKGIELAAMVVPLKIGDFEWDINYTFTRNRSKVVSLPQSLAKYQISSVYDAKFVAIQGQPLGLLQASVPQRDPRGNIIVSSNGFPLVAPADSTYGSSDYDYTMGIMNSFSYKGLKLNFSFDYRKGGVFYSGTADLVYFVGNAYNTTYNDRRPFIIPNSVTAEQVGGKTIYTPNTTPITEANTDDYYYPTSNQAMSYYNRILDKTFLKLRDISLSYSLPQAIIKKISASNLTITLYGSNLWIWTPKDNRIIDPEISNLGNDLGSEFGEFRSGPSTKSYGASLRIVF